MFEKIVIGIDASDASLAAAEQALTLAAAEQSQVYLASVVPAYEGDLRLMGDTRILKSMSTPYEQALEKAKALATARGVPFSTALGKGDPSFELLSFAERQGADLIAVGQKGNFLLDRIAIGSITSKVISLSDLDVLVLPRDRTVGLKRIFLAYDGSASARSAGEKAVRLAESYGATLFVTTVYEMSLEGFALAPDMTTVLHKRAAELQQPVLEFAVSRGVREVVPLVCHGRPVYRALSDLAAQREADLIVIGSRGTGSFKHMLLGSVVERVISAGVCPVLVARSNKGVSGALKGK